MTILVYIGLVFVTMFGIGHWYVNIRKNSYENIFGMMLLLGMPGTVLTGVAALVYELYIIATT